MNDNLNNTSLFSESENSEKEYKTIESIKRKAGRPKKDKIVIIKKPKYLLTYQDTIYECCTMKEIAQITGKSWDCINRLVKGFTTFRFKKSENLKEIIIEKIE